jgi:hypothetical protein
LEIKLLKRAESNIRPVPAFNWTFDTAPEKGVGAVDWGDDNRSDIFTQSGSSECAGFERGIAVM